MPDRQPLLQQVFSWLTDPANWRGTDGIANRLVEHVGICAASLGIACLLAIPLGLWLGHVKRGQLIIINVANAGRAVPTYALLVLLAIGPLGLGSASTIVALVLFAIPPILTNTFTGIRDVDPDIVDAAEGMGLSGAQVLRKVELPLGTPLLLAGVRLSAVQVVATATIAALVAGGGLGRIITAGFGTNNIPELLSGALLVAALAVGVELSFGVLVRRSRARVS
ncbi:MAG: ABC transporter permease [Candidatus Nanopelagicales bacterium]